MSLLRSLFSSKKKNNQNATPEQRASIAKMDTIIEEIRKKAEQQDREFRAEMEAIATAEENYKKDKDIDKLIAFYEERFLNISNKQGNISKCAMRLAELYAKAKKNDKAWGYLNRTILYYAQHPEYSWDLHKVRFAQFKILKSEKRYKDAFYMLVTSYVTRSDGLPNPYFCKNQFLKDMKTTAKGLGLTETDLADFTNQLEAEILNGSLHESGVTMYCTGFFAKHGI